MLTANYIPLGGNMRLRAIKELGMKEIPKSLGFEWLMNGQKNSAGSSS